MVLYIESEQGEKGELETEPEEVRESSGDVLKLNQRTESLRGVRLLV